MDKIRVHLYISGRVQGVGYRYSTYNLAQKLGIFGWVKNTYDGKVEAVFEGDSKLVEEMVNWCYKGPSMATVTNIEIHKEPYAAEFQNFSIRK